MPDSWVIAERRTARLVRHCYDTMLQSALPSAEKLHALCKLTWITRGKGNTDNTRAVLAPALGVLLGVDLPASDKESLVQVLRDVGAPGELVRLARPQVGIVNFYGAFRNSSVDWMRKNRREVWRVFQSVSKARRDADLIEEYAAMAKLPKLPRDGGALPIQNLLTPVLACLDPRSRAPILNGRSQHKLRALGLANATLADQARGFLGLMPSPLRDTFALDTIDLEELQALLAKTRPRTTARSRRKGVAGAPLGVRSDEDIEYIRARKVVQMRRLHNRMTTALVEFCERQEIDVDEGRTADCKFDAHIRAYRGDERSLLIEVKTECTPQFVRMAVGQLLDYRRHLPHRAGVDLAVLLPEKPRREVRAFLDDVGVETLWFSSDFARIEGTVELEA